MRGTVYDLGRSFDSGINTQDLNFYVIAYFDRFLRAIHLTVCQFGDMEQALQARFELDENAEIDRNSAG